MSSSSSSRSTVEDQRAHFCKYYNIAVLSNVYSRLANFLLMQLDQAMMSSRSNNNISSGSSRKRKNLSDGESSESDSSSVDRNKRQNSQSSPSIDLLDQSELGKDLCLLKLPKELIQYRKENANFRLDFKEIKSGDAFKINNIEYEASVTKIKNANKSSGVSFSCVCRNESSGLIKAIDNFKYLIQVKRSIKLPQIEPPVVKKTKIGISPQILNYLSQKNNK